MAAAATPRIIVVGGGLISIYAVVWKYPNAPENVMPAQPAAASFNPRPQRRFPAPRIQHSQESFGELLDVSWAF